MGRGWLALALLPACTVARADTVPAIAEAGAQTCAPHSASAPPLGVLADGARLRLGGADGILSIRVGTAPRSEWGRKLSPRNATIGRTSPWVYIGVPAVDVHDRASIVARQRAVWQASLLVQSLHAAACTAGRPVELGDSIQPPHGTETVAGDYGSGVPPFRVGPFARPGASFGNAIARLGKEYGFRLRSLVALHAVGDAPQVTIESRRPLEVMRNIAVITAALSGRGSECTSASTCFNGFWLEAEDTNGRPFAALSSIRTVPSGVGSVGTAWVRPGLPLPPWVH